MINSNTLKRTRHIILKHQEGSVIRPASEETKQRYARQNNLAYQNGQFFKLDINGNPTTETLQIQDSDLQAFEQKELNKLNTLNQINQGLDVASVALFSSNPKLTNQAPFTQGLNSVYDMASNAVGKVNPLIGTVMKVGGFASDALHAAGLGTDGMTGFDKFGDSKLGTLTGIGLINGIGASKTQDFSVDNETVETVGGSYGGTVSGLSEAKDKAGKKYGLFSGKAKKRANSYINEMRKKQNTLSGIAKEITDQRELVNMMGDSAAQAYSSQIAGGFDPRYFRAKEGGKLPEEFEPEILEIERIVPQVLADGGMFEEVINLETGKIETWKPEIIEADKLKEGGKLEKTLDAPEIEDTSQQNIIPEGVLHKNKHHMDNAENLTKKGIPVVDERHKQQAEIEKNEIIFTKEVTNKLEELYKIFYSENSTKKEKEEAALEAGKLLTKEIMLNTDDRTGLIDTLQQGGTVSLTKPDYKEWLTSVPADWLNENYDLETAYKVVPFEKLERWRKETLKPEGKQSEGTDWHLPSVYQIDETTIMFLKKGKSSKDNPELEGEFKFYTKNPDFSKEWKMQFNKDENRWYYKRRK